jgi:hypothetical protein
MVFVTDDCSEKLLSRNSFLSLFTSFADDGSLRDLQESCTGIRQHACGLGTINS